jgi:hypothetical protein
VSGFEHTARRPPGETPTGPVRIPTPPGMPPGSVAPGSGAPRTAPPPGTPSSAPPSVPPTGAGAETARQRRRVRASGSRTIAVVGVAGGVGATTVSAGLLALLPERVGGPVGLGDHVGGVLRARVPDTGAAAPAGPLVSDLGPHARGDADVLARIGDVVVIVAPLDLEGVRRGEAARRTIVERRDNDAAAAVLVVAENRPTRAGQRRRALAAARESARTVVIRWDPSLADRRPVDVGALSDATRSSFSELCDAIRS